MHEKHEQLKDALVDLHQDAYAWAICCCGQDRQEALDVLQQAYTKVLSGDAVWQGRSSLKTWFFGVIRLTASTQLRTQKRRLVLLKRWFERQAESQPHQSAEEVHLTSERARHIKQMIESLSGKQREVLELIFFHDLTLEETAAVLQMQIGTVRTHYARGKKRLLHLMDNTTQWMESTS